jgi:hypothetical protein
VAAAEGFKDFATRILPCLAAVNDLHDAINLGLSGAAAWALVTYNIVPVAEALAIAAGPFAPLVAMLLLTAAMYFLLQAFTECPDCTSGTEE